MSGSSKSLSQLTGFAGVESVDVKREGARQVIAVMIVGTLLGIVLLSFITLWFTSTTFDSLKALLEILFAPIIGIVGAVAGFYFGASGAAVDRQP